MTNIGWQIVPLDETLLAQWATLRQQLWAAPRTFGPPAGRG
nr:hypothetical protein [Aeromonas veronii]